MFILFLPVQSPPWILRLNVVKPGAFCEAFNPGDLPQIGEGQITDCINWLQHKYGITRLWIRALKYILTQISLMCLYADSSTGFTQDDLFTNLLLFFCFIRCMISQTTQTKCWYLDPRYFFHSRKEAECSSGWCHAWERASLVRDQRPCCGQGLGVTVELLTRQEQWKLRGIDMVSPLSWPVLRHKRQRMRGWVLPWIWWPVGVRLHSSW